MLDGFQHPGPLQRRPPKVPENTPGATWLRLYCLGLVTQDGKILRVSDWQIEAYPQVSQAAQTVSQATGWTLLDAGPHQAIQVQSSGNGTRWATQVDRGWISSLSALFSLVLFVVAVIYQLSHL